MPEVDHVVITAGSFDILAEVVCENDDQLLDVSSSQIRRLDGVRRPRTFVYCGCASRDLLWGAL